MWLSALVLLMLAVPFFRRGKAAMPVAKKELEEIRQLAQERDGIEDVKPWDCIYYREKLEGTSLDVAHGVLIFVAVGRHTLEHEVVGSPALGIDDVGASLAEHQDRREHRYLASRHDHDLIGMGAGSTDHFAVTTQQALITTAKQFGKKICFFKLNS